MEWWEEVARALLAVHAVKGKKDFKEAINDAVGLSAERVGLAPHSGAKCRGPGLDSL